MRMMWDNQLTDLTTMSASSQENGTDILNIVQKHLSKKLSFTTNDGTIAINFGSAKALKKIIIGGSNAGSGATMVLKGNTTATMTSPAFSTTLDLYGETWSAEFDESYQYWQLECEDVSLTKLWLGYVFLGDWLQLPGIEPDYVLNYNTTSQTTLSVSLQPYSDQGIQYFTSAFTFPVITDYARTGPNGEDIATRIDILEMWFEVEGTTPIYLEIAENSLDVIPPFFGIINQDSMEFEFSETQDYYSMSFDFQETK